MSTLVTLNRVAKDLFGTYGVILYGKKPVCHTYELPYRDNRRDVSCILPGIYDCVKYSSPRFGSVIRLEDKNGRFAILIHPGNNAKDTKGCILPGLDVNFDGVVHSIKAMDRLMLVLPETFQLYVKESFNDVVG